MNSSDLVKVLSAGMALAASLHAAPSGTIYTFEKPNFTLGQMAPLLNVAPNTGVPGFETSFVSGAERFIITDIASQANSFPSFFSGQFLQQTGEPSSLTLNFNSPVLSLTVDFALHIPYYSDTGWISFDGDGFWGYANASTYPDVHYQGGTLVIDPGFAFSSVTLYGSNSDESSEFFSLDNLHIATQPVPEPSTWAAIFAVAGVGGWQFARRFYFRGK